MGFVSGFSKTILRNAKKDIQYLRGEGAIAKAEKMYRKIKCGAIHLWNKIIDKMINIVIKLTMDDVASLVKLCEEHGQDPFDYFPDNLLVRLKKRG